MSFDVIVTHFKRCIVLDTVLLVCKLHCKLQNFFSFPFLIAGEGNYVTEISTAVSNQTAFAFFESCKDVQLPAASAKAISSFCGVNEASKCTPQRFLGYMGSKDNGVTPIDTKVGSTQVLSSIFSSILKMYTRIFF